MGDEVGESVLGRGRRSGVSDERGDFMSFSNRSWFVHGNANLIRKGSRLSEPSGYVHGNIAPKFPLKVIVGQSPTLAS